MEDNQIQNANNARINVNFRNIINAVQGHLPDAAYAGLIAVFCWLESLILIAINSLERDDYSQFVFWMVGLFGIKFFLIEVEYYFRFYSFVYIVQRASGDPQVINVMKQLWQSIK